MAVRKVLVTGASGVLGWHLCRSLDADPTADVVATCRENRPEFERVRLVEADLGKQDGLDSLLRRGPFDVIAHTAALTSPDACGSDHDLADRVNVEGTRRLLDLVAPGGRFIFTSTDLVFDGEGAWRTEDDRPNPVNYYGESKLRGEGIVRGARGGVVVRIAKLYSNGSPFHPCFLTWMKERFERGDEVPLFSDQWRTPLCIWDAVGGLRRLFDRQPNHNLYHLGGAERFNRYEFGCRYAEVFGYPLRLIREITMEEAGLVPRGADCSLNSRRFSLEFSFLRSTLVEGLQRLKQELRA